MARGAIVAAAGLAGIVGMAFADQTVATFSFSDLRADYFTADGVTGAYTATARLSTSGDVSLVGGGPAQTANFDPGFSATDSTLAEIRFDMQVSNITATGANGVGSFAIADFDGDRIAGALQGIWTRANAGQTVYYFSGTLTGVSFQALGDGVFEGGASGGQGFVLTPDLLGNLFAGGIAETGFGPASFFASSFGEFDAQFSGVIVPAPAAVAPLLLAVTLGARRRPVAR